MFFLDVCVYFSGFYVFLYVGLVNFRLCLEHVFGLVRKYEENRKIEF